ncbi:MAG: Kdo hydroxylase family protein [Pseudomonadota bacterium]
MNSIERQHVGMIVRPLPSTKAAVPVARVEQGTVDIIRSFSLRRWLPQAPDYGHLALHKRLEQGEVLFFPHLNFELLAQEARFLSNQWPGKKSKHIYLPAYSNAVHGAVANDPNHAELREMMVRYARLSEQLVRFLFPRYIPFCMPVGTSFSPHQIAGQKTHWRKNDNRLHVDAIPAEPSQGSRLLRVVTNINPGGAPRVLRFGEPFRQFATRFVPKTQQTLPGIAWLLHQLGVTKNRRSDYDHLMLQLHDCVKADAYYQRTAPQQEFIFPAGSTWIFFSDQVVHAEMSGQFALDQIFHVHPEGMADPDISPLRILEDLAWRKLVQSNNATITY